MLRSYYQLVKPGIVYGNLLSAVAGFLFVTSYPIDVVLFATFLIGLGLVIASACVFNNYLDRDIDQKMERTKGRALASGTISGGAALSYGALLGVFGFMLLARFVAAAALVVVAIGFVMYVGVYTWAKRRTRWSTVIGSVSGAAPIAAGAAAGSGMFDERAALLFLLMALWQLPHFYAIAIFRLKDYAAAGVPVLPLSSGIAVTKKHLTMSIVAFMLCVPLLWLRGHAGYVYLVPMSIVSVGWLREALRGYAASDDVAWARKLFRFSLVVLLALSIVLVSDHMLR